MASLPHAEWTPLLEELERRRVVAMASAPRMRPDLVFGSVRATPAMSRRW